MGGQGKYVGSKYKEVCSQDGGKTYLARLRHVVQGCADYMIGTFATEDAAAKAYDKGLFLATGDASGPNCGPLTAAELGELAGVTLAEFKAAAKAARAASATFAKGSSAYRGVNRQCGKGWQARIRDKQTGKQNYLGIFDNEEDAARAYDAAALVMHGAAAKLNFPLGAAPAGPDSEPDESEADAARLQSWQDRGKLFLQPLPAPRVEDAVVQYFASAADQAAAAARGAAAMHWGDDADASDGDDEDGDGGSSDSGSDEYWFDEQFPGEAAAAQAGALATLSSAADVQAALAADASLARHPDFSAVLQRIISHGRAEDVDGIRAISLHLWTQHYEEVQTAETAQAAADAAAEEEANLGWLPGGMWRPLRQLTPEMARRVGYVDHGALDAQSMENERYFVPPRTGEDPAWPTKPFCFIPAHGRFLRMRGSGFWQVYEEIDKEITAHKDWLAGTFEVRARPFGFADARRQAAAAADPGDAAFHQSIIVSLLARRVSIMDYEGCEYSEPEAFAARKAELVEAQQLLEDYQAMEAEDRPAYNVLLQTIAASEAQEQAEQAAAAAAAPVHTFAHWADLPPPVPQPIHARGFEPAPSVHFVGHMSADALDEMLAAAPPRAPIVLNADGSETAPGALEAQLRARIAAATATLLAIGDAAAPETRLGDDADVALYGAFKRMKKGVEESEAGEWGAAVSVRFHDSHTNHSWTTAEHELGPEVFPRLQAVHAQRVAARTAAAEADAAAAEVAGEQRERDDAHAADAALAAARAARFEDAEDDADAAAHAHADDSRIFSARASTAAAIADMEQRACAKLGAIDLIALKARIAARIAGASPVVRECLRDVFRGFGGEGTEEEADVRVCLTAHEAAMDAAMTRRETDDRFADAEEED